MAVSTLKNLTKYSKKRRAAEASPIAKARKGAATSLNVRKQFSPAKPLIRKGGKLPDRKSASGKLVTGKFVGKKTPHGKTLVRKVLGVKAVTGKVLGGMTLDKVAVLMGYRKKARRLSQQTGCRPSRLSRMLPNGRQSHGSFSTPPRRLQLIQRSSQGNSLMSSPMTSSPHRDFADPSLVKPGDIVRLDSKHLIATRRIGAAYLATLGNLPLLLRYYHQKHSQRDCTWNPISIRVH